MKKPLTGKPRCGYSYYESVVMRPRSKTTEPSRLSDAVVELRKRLGLTQQQFAERLGVSLAAISRYETDRNPNGDVLLRLRQIARELWRNNREDDDLLDLDDVFYSAVVDEFPLYRHGVSIGLKATANDLRGEIVALADAPESLDRERLGRMIEAVALIERYAEILNPVNFRLSEEASPEEIRTILEPMFESGGARSLGAPAVDAVVRDRHSSRRGVNKRGRGRKEP